MKKFLLTACFISALLLNAEEIFSPKRSADWDGRPALTNEGIFQKKQSSRLISMKSFDVSPDCEYTLSGEFRLVNSTKSKPFFFGFIPRLANGTRIEQKHFRQRVNTTLGEVTEDAKANSREIKVKNAKNYPVAMPGIFAAFNAKADNSDLPNFDIIPIKNIKSENNNATITLQVPLKKDIKKGTLIRLQCLGADFVYVGSSGKILSDQWKTFSGKIKFDGNGHRWFPGTQKANIVMLGGTADGIVEFRNIKVSAEKIK